MIGIYEIVHIATGKRYVGQSINIKERLQEHRRKLRNNEHANPKLQMYWNKYGPDAFRFGVLLGCSKEELDAYEQKYLDEQPWFNIAKFPSAPMRGRKMPKEFGEKLSQALKGKTRTVEQRQRISAGKKGKTFSAAHRAALSRANTGTTRPTNRRQVRCIETGEEFLMIKAVVEKYGGRASHLSAHMSGDKTRQHFRGLHFEYINTPPNWKPRGVKKS